MIMKKVVLSAVILTAVLMSATAQTKKAMPLKTAQMSSMDMSSPTAKGKWLLGPALSFASSNLDDGTNKLKENNFGLHPEIGYFISDGLSVGLSFAFGMQQSKLDGVEKDKSSSLFVAPTFRYYLPISSKFQFLGKFDIPIGSNKTTLSNGNVVDDKITNFGAQLIPAFAFFPSNKISVELEWGGLSFYSTKTSTGTKVNTLSFDLFNSNDFTGLISSPKLGVKWYLGK
jgi:hypothetical protein